MYYIRQRQGAPQDADLTCFARKTRVCGSNLTASQDWFSQSNFPRTVLVICLCNILLWWWWVNSWETGISFLLDLLDMLYDKPMTIKTALLLLHYTHESSCVEKWGLWAISWGRGNSHGAELRLWIGLSLFTPLHPCHGPNLAPALTRPLSWWDMPA